MKILLINSDLAKNRGDRAIAEGNIELIKNRFPDAEITGLSELPERDSRWFGVNFLDMNFQSLNPIDFIRLARAARRSDIVLWGGGEILKDYTNKTALWYWVLKMTLLSLANPNLYGAYQGIGPTKASSSKRLIVSVVNRTRKFIVRDRESYDKLIAWGADKTKLAYASDPAVLPAPAEISPELKQKLATDFNITDEFLNDFITIGPRDWFHYKPGGLLPFKYKQKLYSLIGRSLTQNNDRHDLYIKQLTKAIGELTKKYNTNVLLVPMHMDESDSDLARLLRDHSARPEAVRVLDKDSLSPSELRSVIARAKSMIGFRLHSNIIGISAGVPSVNIYYVDKGRVFFDQINQSRFAMPIEAVLETDFIDKLLTTFDDLYTQRTEVNQEITQATATLRASVSDAFNETFSGR
jgi:polysaccharide pyruvyl transferase WcaK-like protein